MILDKNSVFVPMSSTDLIFPVETWCWEYIGPSSIEWDWSYANDSDYNYDVIFYFKTSEQAELFKKVWLQ